MDKTKPILVTGATGYIASWIIKYLLEDGYTVHATVRNPSKTTRYAHLTAIADSSEGTLKVFAADLLEDGAFEEAMVGCEVVMHTASPFIVDEVADPQKEIVDPAVKGTQNVLESANKIESVQRIVLTSSVVGIYGDPIDAKDIPNNEFNESHWNTSSTVENGPYNYSKVAAERAAWELADKQMRWKMVVVNPAFVFGPSLTNHAGSASIKFMKRLGDGTYRTGIPKIWTSIVDVRDVAKAHILAATKEEASGRHILAAGSKSFPEMVEILKSKFGDKYAFPLMTAPKWLIYIIAPLMGVTRDFIHRNVGYPFSLDNSYSKKDLGITYRPIADTLQEHFQQLIDDGIMG